MIVYQLILDQNKQIAMLQLGLGIAICSIVLLGLVIFRQAQRNKELKQQIKNTQ